MHKATGSVAPYFTHKRMVPKWLAFATMVALVFFFPPERPWLPLLIGVLLFFPSEYVVHRGVFHHFANRPAGKVLSRQHVLHHEDPADLDVLFNDPRISLSIGTVYFFAAWGITRDVGTAAAFSAGNFIGLLYYEHVHLSAHRPGAKPWTPWNRHLKKWHLWHHFKNEHYWYGVTTPLFDFLFRSHADPDQVARSPTVRTLVPTKDDVEWMSAR